MGSIEGTNIHPFVVRLPFHAIITPSECAARLKVTVVQSRTCAERVFPLCAR